MNHLENINKLLNTVANTINLYGYDLTGHDVSNAKAQELIQNVPAVQLSLIQDVYLNYNGIIGEGPFEDESEIERKSRHLRAFLQKHRLKISDKFFDYIGDEHIIEVYAKNHQQLFRSVNFFGLSSYSLEALTFIPWDELFHRSKADFNKLFHTTSVAMDQKIEIYTPLDITHILTELESQKKFRYKLHKVACVLDEDFDEVMGYATIIEVKGVPSLTLLH